MIKGSEWTPAQKATIEELYPAAPWGEVRAALPTRSEQAIWLQGRKQGFRRDASCKRGSKMEVLLEETPRAYYWLGFLLADGSVSDKGRIKLAVAERDKGHLERYAEFIEFSRPFQYRLGAFSVTSQNPGVAAILAQRIGLVQRKTYHPPTLNIQDDGLFLALLAGYTDGDGCFRLRPPRRGNIVLSCHSSWLGFYQAAEERLFTIFGRPVPGRPYIGNPIKKTNAGYAIWNIANGGLLADWKTELLRLGLPLMERKWDKIDETAKGRLNLREERIERIEELKQEGMTDLTKMAERLGIGYPAFWAFYQKWCK